MSLHSDTLLATTGIFPDEITPKQHQAAQGMLPRWERKLRGWVRSEDVAAFDYVDPPDLEKLFTELATPPPEATVTAWIEGLGVGDPELYTGYYLDLTRARDYIVNAWPKYTIDGPSGPKVLPLSQDDGAEVWSLIQVLDDPDRVLDELDATTLTGSQATAFLTCYPDLQSWSVGIIEDELGQRRGKDPDFDLDAEKEAVFATLKGLPPEEPMPLPPSPAEPEKKFKLDAEREQTQAEVSTAPRPRD